MLRTGRSGMYGSGNRRLEWGRIEICKVPLPIGIATFNAIFIAGAILIAKNYDVTKISPAGLKMETLSAGFDLAFILSVVLGVVILIIAIAIREEIHPDYIEETKIRHGDLHG